MKMYEKLIHTYGSNYCSKTICRKYTINKTNYTITDECEFPSLFDDLWHKS